MSHYPRSWENGVREADNKMKPDEERGRGGNRGQDNKQAI